MCFVLPPSPCGTGSEMDCHVFAVPRRYKLMTAYMPTVGTMGLDMMYRTCTVQVRAVHHHTRILLWFLGLE